MADDLEARLERLEAVVDDLKEENRRLREQVGGPVGADTKDEGTMSRRSFLKALGGGALGLGALSLVPAASAFQVTSSNPFTVSNTTHDTLEVDTQGNITASGGNLLWDNVDEHIPASRIEQGSGSGLDADTVDGKHASELGGEQQQLHQGDDHRHNNVRVRVQHDDVHHTGDEVLRHVLHRQPDVRRP